MSRAASQAPSAPAGFISSFLDVLALPRAFWYVIGAFVLDSAAYFGMLTLMTSYLGRDLY